MFLVGLQIPGQLSSRSHRSGRLVLLLHQSWKRRWLLPVSGGWRHSVSRSVAWNVAAMNCFGLPLFVRTRSS
jgi:hypothetical protein